MWKNSSYFGFESETYTSWWRLQGIELHVVAPGRVNLDGHIPHD